MITRREIRWEHNESRDEGGLRPLHRDERLDKSAQIIAERKAKRDKGISHSRVWWKIIDKLTKRRYGALGENLAVGFSSAGSLQHAWMNSLLHRKNIMARKFSRIGIGIARGSRSGRVYVVVHFGGR